MWCRRSCTYRPPTVASPDLSAREFRVCVSVCVCVCICVACGGRERIYEQTHIFLVSRSFLVSWKTTIKKKGTQFTCCATSIYEQTHIFLVSCSKIFNPTQLAYFLYYCRVMV